MVKVPSILGVIKRSKNGMEPSGTASSMVNLMDVSTWLICWKNSSLCDSCWITKVFWEVQPATPLGWDIAIHPRVKNKQTITLAL